jgi:hypothetical protein
VAKVAEAAGAAEAAQGAEAEETAEAGETAENGRDKILKICQFFCLTNLNLGAEVTNTFYNRNLWRGPIC